MDVEPLSGSFGTMGIFRGGGIERGPSTLLEFSLGRICNEVGNRADSVNADGTTPPADLVDPNPILVDLS